MSKTERLPLITSSDAKREERVPPGQRLIADFPVLHYGSVPKIDIEAWRFRVFGLVEEESEMTYGEFMSLPKVMVKADFHCVTDWTRLDNLWEGVSARELMKRMRAKPEAKYVMVHAAPDFTTNLSLEDFLEEDVLFAYKHDGAELSADHGAPLRLVVPKLYAWKSAKWATGLAFIASNKPGFWEQHGYHIHGDPWTEERYGVNVVRYA